jgi:hypothetical protein
MRKLFRLISYCVLFCIAVFFAAIAFWFFGGLWWLQTSVFPPHKPSNMPLNSIWIDAPPLPISWHYGWWFGCDIDKVKEANHCTLFASRDPLNGWPKDSIVYSGSYLSCRTRNAVPAAELKLRAPKDSMKMWIQRPGSSYEDRSAPAGFLRNGDVLIPDDSLSKCDEVLAIASQLR